jgi:hypothetical protein
MQIVEINKKGIMAKIKTLLYIETTVASPFQIEWKELKKDLTFIPYPGLLIKEDNKLLSVINCVYDPETDLVEVYTRQTDLRSGIPETVVN